MVITGRGSDHSSTPSLHNRSPKRIENVLSPFPREDVPVVIADFREEDNNNTICSSDEESSSSSSTTSSSTKSSWKSLFGYIGPGVLVGIGYMDPGNWATDIQAGSGFGFQLGWVLLLSCLIATYLQILAAKLGVITGMDLARMCRKQFPYWICQMLVIIMELAIMATDLAEVLGSSIALNLLFEIPILAGVLITATDTLLFLLIEKLGARKLEAFVGVLAGIIFICLVIQVPLVKPSVINVIDGFVPSYNPQSIVIAVGILGATVMPHNFFLHSSLVLSRKINRNCNKSLQNAIEFNSIDTIISLFLATLVNLSILILSGQAFFAPESPVASIQDAYKLLPSVLGRGAQILFGVALLASGQSSTITGTLAGQVVMQGFVEITIRPWIQRLATRLLAIVPAIITIMIAGDHPTTLTNLVVYSQVILSLALPFAIFPLIKFTNSIEVMSKEFVNKPSLRLTASLMGYSILCLNILLIYNMLDFTSIFSICFSFLLILIVILLLCLLYYILQLPLQSTDVLSLSSSSSVLPVMTEHTPLTLQTHRAYRAAQAFINLYDKKKETHG